MADEKDLDAVGAGLRKDWQKIRSYGDYGGKGDAAMGELLLLLIKEIRSLKGEITRIADAAEAQSNQVRKDPVAFEARPPGK